MLADLLQNNLAWSKGRAAEDPGYVARPAGQQVAESLLTGCSDSRFPANVVAGLNPEGVLVYRDVANVVHSSDLNLLLALGFAGEAPKAREILVCGHCGCGGVKAATEDMPHCLADHCFEPIRRLARAYAVDLAKAEDAEAHRDMLAEFNVVEGERRISETPILQKAWAKRTEIRVHGLIYGLNDGLLRDLDCAVGVGHFQTGAGR